MVMVTFYMNELLKWMVMSLQKIVMMASNQLPFSPKDGDIVLLEQQAPTEGDDDVIQQATHSCSA
jgi:hypothetical protein